MDQDERGALLDKVGVASFGAIDQSAGKGLIEKVQSGAITATEWAYLREVVPNFFDIVSTGLTAIGAVTTALAAAQTEALKVINSSIQAARDIAMSSDDVAVKMRAFETLDSGMKKAAKIDKSGKKTVLQYAGVIGAVIVVGLGAVTVGRRSA